jgi:hypothetical protein
MTIDSRSRRGVLFEGTKGRVFVSRGTIDGMPVKENWDEGQYTTEDQIRLYKGKPAEGHKNNFYRCIREGGLPVSDVYSHVMALNTCHLAAIAARLKRVIRGARRPRRSSATIRPPRCSPARPARDTRSYESRRPKSISRGGEVNHAAVMRGPIVYCLESIDLPEDVAIDQIRLPRRPTWTVRNEPCLLHGVKVPETRAPSLPEVDANGLFYQELPSGEPRQAPIRLIPCYAWNNRGEPNMAVWLPLY